MKKPREFYIEDDCQPDSISRRRKHEDDIHVIEKTPLIDAAPKMLELLERAKIHLWFLTATVPDGEEVEELLSEVKSIISKAKGK